MTLRRYLSHWRTRRILKKIGYCTIHVIPLTNGYYTSWCEECLVDDTTKRLQLAAQAREMLEK